MVCGCCVSYECLWLGQHSWHSWLICWGWAIHTVCWSVQLAPEHCSQKCKIPSEYLSWIDVSVEEVKKFLLGIIGHVEKGKLTDYCCTVPLTERLVLGKLLGMNWWEQIWICAQYSDSAVLECEGDRPYTDSAVLECEGDRLYSDSAVLECEGDRLYKEDKFRTELWIFQTADKPAQALSLISSAGLPQMQNTCRIYQNADDICLYHSVSLSPSSQSVPSSSSHPHPFHRHSTTNHRQSHPLHRIYSTA